MDKIGIIITGAGVFLILSLLFYKLLIGYVRESYGKKWLHLWGNKLYFWQSLLFISGAGTAVIVYFLLKSGVLTT